MYYDTDLGQHFVTTAVRSQRPTWSTVDCDLSDMCIVWHGTLCDGWAVSRDGHRILVEFSKNRKPYRRRYCRTWKTGQAGSCLASIKASQNVGNHGMIFRFSSIWTLRCTPKGHGAYLALFVSLKAQLSRCHVYYKNKLHSSCEIEDFVETHLCKLCVILRSRVLRVVCSQ